MSAGMSTVAAAALLQARLPGLTTPTQKSPLRFVVSRFPLYIMEYGDLAAALPAKRGRNSRVYLSSSRLKNAGTGLRTPKTSRNEPLRNGERPPKPKGP